MPTVQAIALGAAETRDAAVLRSLSSHRSLSVRYAVASNAMADDATISNLLDDRVGSVRWAAASNLAERPALQMAVARSTDKWLRLALAGTFLDHDERSLARDVQCALMEDASTEIRSRMAETTNHLDVFETLMSDDDRRVRAACAANPRITLEQMERLVTDRNWEVRASAVGSGMRYPDDEQILRLAEDRSAGVRWAVVFRVDRPRAALELIAKDRDEMNARLAKSELEDERSINSAHVTTDARTRRARAERASSFER
jgi:hypothetical protein